MLILFIILAIILIFLIILLVRAALFTPSEELKPSGETISLNEDKIVSDMVEMIRCRTVSYNDESLIDKKEFEKFRVLQDRTYQSDFDRLVAETSDDLTE